jgi:DNA-binding NarL/FixJ family response regulator
MPKMNGMEFLKIAKADEKLRRLPVIVLTTSKDEWDRFQSFDLSVAGYIIKPADYKRFLEAIRTIHLYWTLSELPDNIMEPEKTQETAVN